MMSSRRSRSRLAEFGSIAIASATLFLTACSKDTTAPTPVSGITFGQPTPPSGSTIQTTGTVPGAFIPSGSGRLAVPITMTSARELPWAQLNVYLLTADGNYCGQNLPDSPTWGPFGQGQTISVMITGFQVFRVPCEVTGFHAYLHTRNNGNLTPPTASETVADGTLFVNYTIR